MSNCKAGEGLITLAPLRFTNHHLRIDVVYQVIVLAGSEVVESSWVKVVLPGSVILPGEMLIYAHPNNWFMLSSRSSVFYSQYSEFHDVLIKDSHGRTLAALTNVEVTRE